MTFLKKVFGGGGGRSSSATTTVTSNDVGISGGGGKVSKLTETATPNSVLVTPADTLLVPHTVATPTLNNLVPHSTPPPLNLSAAAPDDGASTTVTANATSSSPSTASSVPQKQFKFGDFEVTRTLGTGSFGRVCLALHRPTGIYYAMKKLRKSDVVRLKQVEHTNNERSLLASVNHPFLVRMTCTFQDERHLYIILEYISGGELFSLLRKVRVRS